MTSQEGEERRRAARDYYESGAGSEITLRANEAAWAAVRFRPHGLRDVRGTSTATSILGQALAAPILVAPAALHGLAHPEGECETARGVCAAGSLLVVSMRASRPVEEIAVALGGAPWWYQVYATIDRSVAVRLAGRAAAAGAQALVLTADTPVVARKARASGQVVPAELHLANLRRILGAEVTAEGIRQDPSVTPSFIGELAAATGLPVLVKGILRGDDACEVVQAGAGGLVVSNHGGRQLDQALPTVAALPDVVAAVAGRVPVLVDGGIRTGRDVLAALALGADAVLLGRPVLRALLRGGASEVTALLQHLRAELLEALQLAGCSGPAEATRDLLAV